MEKKNHELTRYKLTGIQMHLSRKKTKNKTYAHMVMNAALPNTSPSLHKHTHTAKFTHSYKKEKGIKLSAHPGFDETHPTPGSWGWVGGC